LIDVAALETYINDNRERIVANEEDFEINLSTMISSAQKPAASASAKQADTASQSKAQPAHQNSAGTKTET
jgi:hypothetical protein